MGHRFVIKSMRMDGWLRMHDTQTGEQFEVPIPVTTTLRPGNEPEQGGRGREVDAAAPTTPTEMESHRGTRTSATERPKKKTSRKSGSRKSAREGGTVSAGERASKTETPHTADSVSPWAPGKQNPLESQEGRMTPLDEKSLTSADRKVMEEHQTFWAHVQAKTNKRGGLGWEETTDAGRSGLRARHKSGAFKILHAGGDTYALFYEWDSGKFEKIACGKAEEMMELAQKRTQEKLPPPPRTLLDLEMARHMCASDPEQRRIAVERLAPIFRELDAQEEERRMNDADVPPTPTRRRRSPKSTASPPVPAQEPQVPPAANDGVDAQRDAALMASFSQALAELEDD